jgi:phage shock protein E
MHRIVTLVTHNFQKVLQLCSIKKTTEKSFTMTIEKVMQEKLGTIVDVRTTAEFMGGHVAGAKNIPLQDVPHSLAVLQQLPAPLILCCASGNRSGQAQRYLADQGINCINGGAWTDVNYLVSQFN